MRKLFTFRRGVIAALMLIAGGLAAYPALATVTVTPMIAVIEGRDRYADLNLINTSGQTESYALSWRFYKMVEGEGTYENIEESLTDFDLSKHLVMTPRRVSIEPGGMQKIRIGLRLKGEPPPPGDYRAHLMLMQDAHLKTNSIQPLEKGKMSVGIGVNVGLSVPVVYRVGESDATATIGDVTTRLNPNTNRIEVLVPVTRQAEGRYGILGHIKIMYDGKMVGEVRNANIFDEITSRTFTVPLRVSELKGGALEIIYKDHDKLDDTIYAQKTVPVR